MIPSKSSGPATWRASWLLCLVAAACTEPEERFPTATGLRPGVQDSTRVRPSLVMASGETCYVGGTWPDVSTAPGPVYFQSCSTSAVGTPEWWFSGWSQAPPQGVPIGQREPVTITFSSPVYLVRIEGGGALDCRGTFGSVVAYDSANREVEHGDFSLTDPADCGEDEITGWTEYHFASPGLVSKLVLSTPLPFEWVAPQGLGLCGCSIGHLSQGYFVYFHEQSRSVQVKISYAEGTRFHVQGGDSLPQILPDSLLRGGRVIESVGSPPLLGRRRVWPDSLIMRLRVDSMGVPVPNQTITLQALAIDSSGAGLDAEFGHRHPGRSAEAKPAGSFRVSTVNTGASGEVTVVYRPSIVSGPVVLVAAAESADTARATVWVGVDSLVELVEGTRIDTVGTTGEHPAANGVTVAMREKLTSLADSIWSLWRVRAQLNDASLPWGGKFDIRGHWVSDPLCRTASGQPDPGGCHAEHRIGRNVDFNSPAYSPARQQRIWAMWESLGGRVVKEGTHFHFRYLQ